MRRRMRTPSRCFLICMVVMYRPVKTLGYELLDHDSTTRSAKKDNQLYSLLQHSSEQELMVSVRFQMYYAVYTRISPSEE
jgi:hypothetical protein